MTLTPASAPADAQTDELQELRVLVVDDGAENRELVQLVLGDVGLEVTEAENGQIGVDKALAHDAPAIVAIVMGVVTGVAGGMMRDLLAGRIEAVPPGGAIDCGARCAT